MALLDAVALTTYDNPYSPFDEFLLWLSYDNEKGYHTCEYLAHIANSKDGMTDDEETELIEEAIDKIIASDFLHIYKKVYKSGYVSEPKEDII